MHMVFFLGGVAIHTPARGATTTLDLATSLGLFQFTRPQWARPKIVTDKGINLTFQFTRPQGARR